MKKHNIGGFKVANKRVRKKLLRKYMKYGDKLKISRDFNVINEHVQVLAKTWELGFYSLNTAVGTNVHVDGPLLESFLLQTGNQYKINKRSGDKYPFEVSFCHGNAKYYAIYSEKEFKNTFGGFVHEHITKK